jgi:MoxR-like ATPase
MQRAQAVLDQIGAVYAGTIVGQRELRTSLLVTLMAQGHILLESVPGLAKTTAAATLARAVNATFARIQCTPDLLPSDIIGTQVFEASTSSFRTQLGPVHAHFVLLDEINRSSAKTQSAMLEAMQERQTSIGGKIYPMPSPFMVLATQNPIEMDGTYPLPEAQRDRFTARVSMGYPDPAAELAMIDEHAATDPLDVLRPVTDARLVQAVIDAVHKVHMGQEVRQYCVDLVSATRRLPELRLGASPRATLQLVRTARAQAALSGRSFVVPDDVHAVAVPVLAHRLLLTPDAQANRRSPVDIVRTLVARTPVPTTARPGG